MKKISIIGGYGFIGQNICENFDNKNYSLNIIGRNSSNKALNYLNIQEFFLDINDTEKIANITDGNDVIWLATSLVPGHHTELIKEFEANIRPIIKYLEFVKSNRINIGKFIYISSGGTVYGDSLQEIPISEDYFKNPISSYGLSKLVTEDYIKFLTIDADFQSIIIRPSNIYGRYQNLIKPQGIMGFALKAAKENSSIKLYDDGKVIRDFVHVKDFCSALVKVIESQKISGEFDVYNLGSGTPYTIKQIVEKVKSVTQHFFYIINEDKRPFDCYYNVLNYTKFKDKFNWAPQIDINIGIADTWEWMKNKN